MTSTIVFALIGVLAIGGFLLFGALAEAYRGISQLREKTGVIDEPLAIDLTPALRQDPSALGLPRELDHALRAVVVYVQASCATCRMIVNSLGGGVPTGVWLVAAAQTRTEAATWLAEAGFAPDELPERIRLASIEEIQERLGVRVTPLAISIKNGSVVGAQTVPSTRQFYSLVPTILSLPRAQKSVDEGEVAV